VAGSLGGRFPEAETGLRTLPGIGPYTAAAIAAIAFDQPATVVDGNVERVVARLRAVETPLPEAKPRLAALAAELAPEERPGDHAQAMMDLGATICTSRDPRCLLCPLATGCRAQAEGDPARLPVKAAKKPKPHRQGTAFWIEREGEVWLVRRPGKGMLGGMRALPDDGWSARVDGTGDAPIPGQWRAGGVVRHGFTHFDLELGLAIYAGEAFDALEEGEWWPVAEIERAGIPTLFAKAAMLAVA
jgi:A/G-specific adenine glycosylase